MVAWVIVFHLASPVWANRATAVTAASTAASVAHDQEGRAPNPTKCAIVPSGPVALVSHATSGGAASMASARAAVSAAAQLTSRARLAAGSRSSGFSDEYQRGPPR